MKHLDGIMGLIKGQRIRTMEKIAFGGVMETLHIVICDSGLVTLTAMEIEGWMTISRGVCSGA